MKILKNLRMMVIVQSILFPLICRADFQVGLDAYQNKNYAIALKEFEHSAKDGNPYAKHYLGKMYVLGLGVKRDLAKGFEYIDQAFTQVNTDLDRERKTVEVNQKNAREAQALVGQRVCRNGVLSYTYQIKSCTPSGHCVYVNQVMNGSDKNGQIIGNVESRTADKARLQIRIESWASNLLMKERDSISLIDPPLLDKQVEAKKGSVIWDDSTKWFLCPR